MLNSLFQVGISLFNSNWFILLTEVFGLLLLELEILLLFELLQLLESFLKLSNTSQFSVVDLLISFKVLP